MIRNWSLQYLSLQVFVCLCWWQIFNRVFILFNFFTFWLVIVGKHSYKSVLLTALSLLFSGVFVSFDSVTVSHGAQLQDPETNATKRHSAVVSLITDTPVLWHDKMSTVKMFCCRTGVSCCWLAVSGLSNVGLFISVGCWFGASWRSVYRPSSQQTSYLIKHSCKVTWLMAEFHSGVPVPGTLYCVPANWDV